MEPILVPRIRLIGIIEGNRAKHVSAHRSAVEGWLRKQIDAIQKASAKALKVARAGKQASLNVHMQKPTSHVKEYDRVIDMLRMDTSQQIKLDANDYDRFVKDEWQWKDEFIGTTAMYAGKVLHKALRRK